MKDGIEKRQKLAKQELEETLAGINKQERDTLKKMEEAEKKGVKITPEEKKAVKTNAQQQRLVAYQQYAKDLYAIDKEFQEKDLKSWIEYNKEYGTYQQKRTAIMKEYALKSSQEDSVRMIRSCWPSSVTKHCPLLILQSSRTSSIGMLSSVIWNV